MPSAQRKQSRRAARTWRRGPEPDCSVLSKRPGRPSSQASSRFSALPRPARHAPGSPLSQIPTLAGWLAARAQMTRESPDSR